MDTVSFRCALGKGRWMAPDGSVTDNEAQAALFEFRRSPTGMDERKIKAHVQRFCGELESAMGTPTSDVDAWVARRLAIQTASDTAYRMVERIAFPDGVPRAEGVTDEAYLEQRRAALERAWFEVTDEGFVQARERYFSLALDMADLSWWARWQVLCVKVPAGWERVQDHPAYVRHSEALVRAWTGAFQEPDRGNGLPSAS